MEQARSPSSARTRSSASTPPTTAPPVAPSPPCKAAGVNPLPPITGQDAELAAIQRILTGDQYMTVYKAFKPEADKAAEIAVALAKGEKPDRTRHDREQRRGDVPSFLLEPQVAVTKDNVKDTVIADGFYTVERDLHRRVRGRLQAPAYQTSGR